MRKTLVLGCGNIFAGDDGVGVQVAERLRARRFPPEVEIVQGETGGLLLLDSIRGAKKVIIVDAFWGGAQVGEVVRLTEEDLLSQKGFWRSPHHLGIPEILSLVRILEPENFPEEVVIIGIQVPAQRKWSFGLSPLVEAAVEKAVAAVEEELAKS